MLMGDAKKKVQARLRRIAGQVEAIERMVDEERYCVDVLTQVAAVQAALGKAGEEILRAHVETCVAGAIRSGDARARKRKVDELIEVIGRFRP